MRRDERRDVLAAREDRVVGVRPACESTTPGDLKVFISRLFLGRFGSFFHKRTGVDFLFIMSDYPRSKPVRLTQVAVTLNFLISTQAEATLDLSFLPEVLLKASVDEELVQHKEAMEQAADAVDDAHEAFRPRRKSSARADRGAPGGAFVSLDAARMFYASLVPLRVC